MHRLAIAAVISLAAAPAAAADCPNSDARPDEIGVSDYVTALVCEVNEQRREWGRPALSLQRNLAAAASWHAADMVGNGYFAHSEPDGDTLADRLDRANFIPSSDRWGAAENLAAGRAAEGTPASIAAGWMNSRDHRLNMLDPDFTAVGVGVTRGWPAPDSGQNDSVVVDMDLGWRAFGRRGSP